MKIMDFKYNYNLMTTLSAVERDLCLVDFRKENFPINFSNSINLHDLVSQFNDQYMAFQEEYGQLQDLQIGPISYINISNNNGNRILSLGIVIPSYANCEIFLIIVDDNGKFRHLIPKRTYGICRELTDMVKLDYAVVKEYMDVFEKYRLFLDAYQKLQRGFVFGNGTTTLFTYVEGKVLDKLTKFNVAGGIDYFMSPEKFFTVDFQLGKDLLVIPSHNKTFLTLNNDRIEDSETLEKLTYELYINRSKLPKMYALEDNKKMVKERKWERK